MLNYMISAVAKLATVCVLLVVTCGVVSSARAQEPEWVQRLVGGPSARAEHAMTYDAARGVTVLFGGVSDSGAYLGDTWEWDGTTWTQRVAIGGPMDRFRSAMAYDAARGVTVLFGGLGSGGNGGYFQDTWEYNGTTWTQRTVSGPSERYLHAMAYDSARGVTVLFGGIAWGQSKADTWEWNGTTWSNRTVSGPSARYLHAMAYDSARGVTVLFGGTSIGQPLFAETWEWNGTEWTLRMIGGPSGRVLHSMAYDSSRGVTVLFGGDDSKSQDCCRQADTWEWDGAAWTQRMISGPSARTVHSMAYDSVRDVTVLFGGYAVDGVSAETWELGSTDCPADFNGDGFVNGDDYDSFAEPFESGEAAADINGDGFVNGDDFDYFAEHFEAGC